MDAVRKEERLGGIGGSDAAIVCGLSPWKTPVQLWLEKTRQAPEEEPANPELIRWGHLLEEIIGKEWAHRSGHSIRRFRRLRRSAEHPFMLANIDFDIVGKREGLECKNASAWTADRWGDNGTDQVPLFYLTQGVHYMHVFGYDAWNYGILLGGNELRSYRIERDSTAERTLIELEAEFWTCVEERRAPPPIKLDDVLRIHPAAHGAVPATEEIALKVYEFAQLKEKAKELDALLEPLKLAICEYMADKGDLLDPHDPTITLATWRSHSETRVDTKTLKAKLPGLIEQLAAGELKCPEGVEVGAWVGELLGPFFRTSTVRKFLHKV